MNRSTLWPLGAPALGRSELKEATRWSLAVVRREPSRLERMTRVVAVWPVGSFRREPWLERNRTAIVQAGTACAVGVTATLLFEPRAGRRRRRRMRDRSVALTRRGVRQ